MCPCGRDASELGPTAGRFVFGQTLNTDCRELVSGHRDGMRRGEDDAFRAANAERYFRVGDHSRLFAITECGD